ncbi:MAG: hypothetical protein IJ814_03485 [Paludibacteraceae bacterium]|nr:hypothetical protein [Paludibacteraceae bacterium]
MTGCSECTKNTCTLYEGMEFADERMERGVKQAAALWTEEDGSAEDFRAFAEAHYARTEAERTALFESLSRMMERLNESADMLTVELLKPTQLTNAGEPTDIDWIMSGYDARAHLMDDLFANKIAFITILNFPFYTLEEKNALGSYWTRREWAEARLGDVFTSRVPAKVQANLTEAMANAENYIADYNICMDRLRTEDGRQLFPDGMKLLSHWNLRDELKVDYADQEKQEMIYQVMQRIVRQDIPQAVINNATPVWQPYSNTVQNGSSTREPDTRYQKILDVFHAMQKVDQYCPNMPTGIIRNFEGDIEMTAAEVDSLFREFLGSEQVATVAKEIRKRLGRELRPYDIWYDGFKARSGMDEEALSAETRKRFPSPLAYEKKIPAMLTALGFAKEDAEDIARHIVVEPARGSGHAWPCVGRNEPTRLRTRIAPEGMDYKGYNIAVHEMGHNVEEVISLYRIDYYMLHGIPNTGFTETSAFLFQARDLQLLGYGKQAMDREAVLDQFWGMYEIMGVSLVDMQMWQWLYAHPKATAAELREAVLRIAAEVWNKYYEPVLGEKDCVLLAIYSHMVNSPMYLPNYPIGHIVQFQLEQALADKEGRAWAEAYERWYRLGRLTPQQWMKEAVDGELSVEPVLKRIEF